MENSFIPKAIDTVKDAIAADTAQEYEIALGLYKKSLEYFMTGLKYEPNPVGARSVCDFFCVVPAPFLTIVAELRTSSSLLGQYDIRPS